MKNQKKKKSKKKINQLNTYITEVLQTTEKINYAQLLLKDLKPYLSTSEDRIMKRKLEQLSNIIEEIQQDQIGWYVNTKTKLEQMHKNATIAYEETLNNSFLDTITELKNVITKAKHTYTTIYYQK